VESKQKFNAITILPDDYCLNKLAHLLAMLLHKAAQATAEDITSMPPTFSFQHSDSVRSKSSGFKSV
jgi:hypothetical protein